MEDSIRASVGKAIASHQDTESGWTAYLEDFSNNQDNSSCSSFYTPSMVSDAASPIACNHISGKDFQVFEQSSHIKVPKNLRYMKKKKTREVPDDDSLEDTASSPVNSPKVGYFKPVDMNSRKGEDHDYSSMLGKESALGGTTFDGRHENNFDGRKDYMDLKDKGLCLVPISNLVNYIG